MTDSEMTELLSSELARFQNAGLRLKLEALIREPVEELRRWHYSNVPAHYPCWRFADLGERGVWAGYCAEGFGALGSPWGLLFEHDLHIGMDCEWFPTLEDLAIDWF